MPKVWFFAIFVVWAYRKNDENCQLWLGCSPLFFLEEQLHSLAPKGFQIWLELVSKVCPKTSKWIWDPIYFQASNIIQTENCQQVLLAVRTNVEPLFHGTCHQVCFQFPHSVFSANLTSTAVFCFLGFWRGQAFRRTTGSTFGWCTLPGLHRRSLETGHNP